MPDCDECHNVIGDKLVMNDIYNRDLCALCHENLPDEWKLPDWKSRRRGYVTPSRGSWGIDEVLDI